MISSLTRSALVTAVCLLTGCSAGLTGSAKGEKLAVTTGALVKSGGAISGSTVSPTARSDVRQPLSVSVSPDSAVEKCGRELKTLKRLDMQRYTQRKSQFDRLMSGASVYADVRKDVAGGTQEAVDAMYRFRTGKLCAEISRDVLDALARQEGGTGG